MSKLTKDNHEHSYIDSATLEGSGEECQYCGLLRSTIEAVSKEHSHSIIDGRYGIICNEVSCPVYSPEKQPNPIPTKEQSTRDYSFITNRGSTPVGEDKEQPIQACNIIGKWCVPHQSYDCTPQQSGEGNLPEKPDSWEKRLEQIIMEHADEVDGHSDCLREDIKELLAADRASLIAKVEKLRRHDCNSANGIYKDDVICILKGDGCH